MFVLRQDTCCFLAWDLRQLGQGPYCFLMLGLATFETRDCVLSSFGTCGSWDRGFTLSLWRERYKAYDECEAEVGCFIDSITSWLVRVKSFQSFTASGFTKNLHKG